MNPADFVFKPV